MLASDAVAVASRSRPSRARSRSDEPPPLELVELALRCTLLRGEPELPPPEAMELSEWDAECEVGPPACDDCELARLAWFREVDVELAELAERVEGGCAG